MFTSQLIVNGVAKGAEVQRAFGLPGVTVKRSIKLFREKGTAGFFAPKVYRGAAVLTDGVLKEAQSLLDDGLPRKEVASRMGVKIDTFTKAIKARFRP
jgi:hypothetical protein